MWKKRKKRPSFSWLVEFQRETLTQTKGNSGILFCCWLRFKGKPVHNKMKKGPPICLLVEFQRETLTRMQKGKKGTTGKTYKGIPYH